MEAEGLEVRLAQAKGVALPMRFTESLPTSTIPTSRRKLRKRDGFSSSFVRGSVSGSSGELPSRALSNEGKINIFNN